MDNQNQKDPLGILGGQPKKVEQPDPLGILKKKASETALKTGGKVGTSEAPLVGEIPKGFEGLKPAKVQPVEYKEPVVGEDTMLTRKMERAQKQAISGTEVRLPAAPKAVAAERGMQRAVEPMVEKTIIKDETPKTERFFKGGFGKFLDILDAPGISIIPLGDFIDDIGRSLEAGRRQGTTIVPSIELMKNGAKSSPEDIRNFIEVSKNVGQVPPSDEMLKFRDTYEKEGKDVWAFIKGLAQNPGVAPQIMASSISALATNPASMATLGSIVGGGAAIGAATGPGALATAAASLPYAMGAATGVLEAGATFAELLQDELNKKNLDFTEDNVKKILEDEKTLSSLRARAATRAAIIGTFDALTGRIAGRVGAKIPTSTAAGRVKSGLAAAGIEAAGGAAGEATARKAIGQEMDAAEIGLEGLAQAPTAVISVTSEIYGKPSYKINGELRTKADVEEVLNNAPSEEIKNAKIEISNDPITEAQVKEKVETGNIKRELKEVAPEISDEKAERIASLEKQLKKFEQGTTQISKDKAAAIREEIKNVSKETEAAPQVPAAEEKTYRVEYFDPETRKMTHQMFATEAEGEAFKKTLTREQTSQGVRSYFEKAPAKGVGKVEVAPETSPKIPREISSLKDDESVVFTVKSLEEIPEEFKDRAIKKEGLKAEVRKKIFGFPIGPKTEVKFGEGYTYTLTGKEAKNYAAKQIEVSPTSSSVVAEEKVVTPTKEVKTEKVVQPVEEVEAAPQVPAAPKAQQFIEVKSPKEVKQGDTIVWRGEDFTVEEVNPKGGFNLKNVKDPTWTVKDARVTDEEFGGKRGEVEAEPEVPVKETAKSPWDIVKEEEKKYREKQQIDKENAKKDIDLIKSGDEETIEKYFKKSGYKEITEEDRDERLKGKKGVYKSTGASITIKPSKADAALDTATNIYNKKVQGLPSFRIEQIVKDFEKQKLAEKEEGKAPSELPSTELKPEEYAVQEPTAGEVPVQPEAGVSEEVEGGVPPTEPPTTTEEGKAEGEGEEELRKLAANVPDTGKVSEYLSKGTIEKYTGETPTSPQERGVQELRIALEHGEKIIDKAKELFGKDYVEKTLDFIEKSQVSTSNKALMYVSLENALGKEKLDFPDRANEITKQQALVYKASQAFARESSLALNYQKLRKVAQVGYDSSKITDNFFTSEELEGKQKIEEAIEASPDQVNKAAEEREVETEEKVYTEKELEQKVEEGVRSEVEKLFEQLPKESKSRAQKALNVLADLKKKLRSRTYDATLGIPVAIIDAGITTIENAIKLGISVENAIDLGIKKIKEKLKGKEWAKEDDFRKDMLEEFKAQKVDTKASSSPMTIKQSVKEALIKKGFGREVTIKGEKKTILDWKKLAGKAGTVEKIQENVESAMKDQGYSEKEISDMKDQYIQEYIDLRQSIIEKAQNELARRNKSKVSPKQKSAAKRLAELYTLGLFEEKKDEFDNVLNSALGTDVSVKAFDEAKKIAEAMESIYAATFNGVRLTDVSAKSALEKLEDNLRILLYEESKRRGNFALRAANLVRSYFDISQTMILNSLKNTIENPLSGLQQKLIDKLFLTIGKETTPELVKERRKLMKDIYKDMVINGGIGYGNVESQFVNRRHLDDYVNKLSDNKLYQGIASVVTGKAALNAMDAMFKAGLTEARFTSNLVRILTSPSNPNQMSKAEAIKFVSEKLTGQTLEDAKKTSEDIIKKINEDAGQELIKPTPEQINRFANDIVKAALEMNNTITSEQIMAAYNAAYKSAGLSVGHEANNMLSDMVRSHSAKLEGKINNSIKEKEWNNAALLTLRSIIFRNILNPFVGGGTNWLVLKFEKTGLGLFTGLAYEYSGRKDIDVTSKAGLEKLEKRLFNQSRAKDSYMRGLVGGLASMLTYAAFLGLADSEEYRRWRAKNKWAARYLDLITPEVLLAQMAIENKNFKQYVSTTLNKNDAFDATNKLIKSGEYGLKGEKAKALGALGEAVGSKLNAPLPWRLVRDGQIIYQGIKGEDPYHGNFKQSEGFWSGALQGGAIEWLGFRPMSKGLDVALFTITDPVSGEKREVTEAERLKVKNEMVKIYNELLRDYKGDYKDIWLDLSGKVRISTRGIKDAEIDTWKSKTYKQLNKEQQEQLDDKIKEKALNSAKKILSEE